MTLISTIETQARRQLLETTASFWTSAELVDICIAGIKDLWRDIVDLKAEHFFTVDTTNVSMAADTATLTGVPSDVHKVYLIEPADTSETTGKPRLKFTPLDYNHDMFASARSQGSIDATAGEIFYAVVGAGSPVAAPTIYVAPTINAAVTLRFVYVPTLATMTSSSTVPIPGEADNALVAWTVAYARAKEREDRMPDPGWLSIYGTEKQHLLQSLGLRQYQEPTVVDGLFSEYWR